MARLLSLIFAQSFGRPCQRCVNLGKQDTCVDVQHKKRGRPRLRDDSDRTNSAPPSAAPTISTMLSASTLPPHLSMFAPYGQDPAAGLSDELFLITDTTRGLRIVSCSPAFARQYPGLCDGPSRTLIDLWTPDHVRDERVEQALSYAVAALETPTPAGLFPARAMHENYDLLASTPMEDLVEPVLSIVRMRQAQSSSLVMLPQGMMRRHIRGGAFATSRSMRKIRHGAGLESEIF
ncbi:uncharacterized protein V1518DRAFT_14015 [Limtongia smithiae]|uniref:uncharacterized protein n=1 Tax=Limtongia smithiae TaxID=1125753 RepID=UPI0034CD5B19